MWDVSVMTTHRNPSLYTYGTIDWDRMLSNLIVLDKEGGPKVAYAGKLRCESCNRSMVNLIKESISGKMLCIDCIIQSKTEKSLAPLFNWYPVCKKWWVWTPWKSEVFPQCDFHVCSAKKSFPPDENFEFLYCDEGICFFCTKECLDR
jgi:hypothetical protein